MNLNKLIAEHGSSLSDIADKAKEKAQKERKEKALEAAAAAQSLIDEDINRQVLSLRALRKQINEIQSNLSALNGGLSKMGKLQKCRPHLHDRIVRILSAAGVDAES